MVCYLVFKNAVKNILKKYNINDEQSVEILQDIEREVGHNHELIGAVVDLEGENLIKRLKKKEKKKEIAMTYA
ncbi:hypothetical protein H0N95_00580 [Candidatus Micrarchaeota archaeon]|nr:hypothetical protein [Candidatus Micrarchaeota archaeon]